jgi:hypothetical protein
MSLSVSPVIARASLAEPAVGLKRDAQENRAKRLRLCKRNLNHGAAIVRAKTVGARLGGQAGRV